MKKIEIFAPLEEISEMTEFLQHRGVVQLTEPESVDGLEAFPDNPGVSNYGKYEAVANETLNILDKFYPEKSGLLDSFVKQAESISEDEYKEKSAHCDEYLKICNEIVAAKKKADEAEADKARTQMLMSSLEPWLGLDISMKQEGTKYTSAFIGTLPSEYTDESFKDALLPLLGDEDRYECEIVSSQKGRSNLFLICHNECKDEILSALRELGFAYPSDPTKHPPAVRYERFRKKIEDDIKEKNDSVEFIKSCSGHRNDIKFASDYFADRKERYSALNNISFSRHTFCLTGYIPEKNSESIKNELEGKFNAACSVTEPGEDEDVPVLLENKPFAAAVEPVTEMYSMPSKTDIDPNPVMAAFYYLLFGIMLSDAGYGLLMVIGTAFAKIKFKPTGKFKKTVDMYFYCGIATVFWGALFGSWFGDIINVIFEQFLNRPVNFIPWNPGSAALWFEPVNDPMKLMLYSFLFGIIHLFFGLGASFVKMWKQGNKIGAVCDVIPVYLLITGIAPLGAGILIDTIPAWVSTAGKYLALAGAVLIVLTAGRDSKNIAGKLGLGLYGLYNAASGWLSDILSYSRLLALGLCTGVIATVVNTLGTIPENKTVKLCLLIPVFIFGHTVNMAINLIGTYVHTNRLQYVEFFAKFYEGGGRSFTPLKSNSKYYKFKED